jgi:uncharacterized membrane protein YedE/YeeE
MVKGVLQQQHWPAWICGAIAGIMAAIATVWAGKLMGTSGTFENLASMCVSFFNLGIAETYFSRVRPPVVSYQVIQAVGILLGAFVSALLSRSFRPRLLPDNEWVEQYGGSRVTRWAILFIGCILLEIGAGMAGGCTSGLGISGTMLLSPAGLLFIVGVFASGIVVTKLIYGGRY